MTRDPLRTDHRLEGPRVEDLYCQSIRFKSEPYDKYIWEDCPAIHGRSITMSWFWRGFQSAIFYYLSCAPCTKLAYQRRRRKANQRARMEEATIEAEQGLYQHPTPFSTNIYWREEMMLGPGPPQKKGNRDRDKQKTESSRGLRSGGAGSSSLTGASSADTVVVDEIGEREQQERRSGEHWNIRRYQREDETLWGIDRDLELGRSRSSTTGSGGNYYVPRNPAVNDLHPPVVSTQPTDRNETRWMLQPPPSAKIMEGKVKAKRSRSGSGFSNRSDSSRKRDDANLGRRVGERLMEEKVKRGEKPPLSISDHVSASVSMMRLPSRESAKSEPSPQSQRHDRDPQAQGAHIRPSRPQLTTIPSSSIPKYPRSHLLPVPTAPSLQVFQSFTFPAPEPPDSPSPLSPSPRPPSEHELSELRPDRWPWDWRIPFEEGGGVRRVDGREHGARWSMEL